jgi:hypothetical protein
MSKYLRYGIIEDLDTVRHVRFGSFWGVRLSITPLTWLSPFVFFGLRLLLRALVPGLSLGERIVDALLFTLAVEVVTVLHAFGHILSGKLVGSPMNELLITATRDVNVYDGPQTIYPGYVHLGRALGGPLFNLLTAGLLYAALPLLAPSLATPIVARIASMSLFFGVGGFPPLPSVDGEVIWRELLRPLRVALQARK